MKPADIVRLFQEAAEEDDENVCPECEGEGVDVFGFDCRACLGTGEVKDE